MTATALMATIAIMMGVAVPYMGLTAQQAQAQLALPDSQNFIDEAAEGLNNSADTVDSAGLTWPAEDLRDVADVLKIPQDLVESTNI